MKLTVQRVQEQILSLIDAAVKAAQAKEALPQGEIAPFIVEVPADKQNGD